MSANGMVRPCSRPASAPSCRGGHPRQGVPETQQQSRRRGALVLRQKWSRGQVEARLANLPPCLVGMEACIGAHHLSRHPTGSAMPFRSAAVQKPDVNQGVVPFQQGATNGHPLLCSLPACCAVQAAWVVLAKVKPEGWEPLSRDRVGEVTLAPQRAGDRTRQQTRADRMGSTSQGTRLRVRQDQCAPNCLILAPCSGPSRRGL